MALSYHHVTVAGDGTKDGSTWANAMGLSEYTYDLINTTAANDVYFIKSGTYNFTGNVDFNARNGTYDAPIVVAIGVKSATTHEGADIVYSDWETTAENFPYFNLGAYYIRTGAFPIFQNIYMQGTSTYNLRPGAGAIIKHCKFDNNYSSASARYAIYCDGTGVSLIDSEFSSANCHGIYASASCRILNCYINNTNNATYGIGVIFTSSGGSVLFTNFNNCRVGIDSVSRDNSMIINNTFRECATCLQETDGNSWIITNNILEGSDTCGFKWTTQVNSNLFWKNHGDDVRNTDMWSGIDETTIFKDYLASTGDPKFTSSTDLSLQSDSPCINNGLSTTLGISGNGRISQGAWQIVAGAAASGSLLTHPSMNGGMRG